MEKSSNLRNLLSVLAAQHPEAVFRRGFLHRALLVEGLCFSTSPTSLRSMFAPFGVIEVAVLVRDGGAGERVGLVVFTDSGGCSMAASAPPFPRCYRRLTQVSAFRLDSSFAENSLLAAQKRGPMSERLASTLPPSYLNSSAAEEIHLRCVFLLVNHECCGHEDGALRVYDSACRLLSATGNASAIVLCEQSRVATVVFDESVDTERVASSSSRLLPCGAGVYDLSLFPVCAGTGALDRGGPLLQLLPMFCHSADYRGRVVIFNRFDTTGRHRDAGVITEGVQRHLGHLHRLQALLVHPTEGLVVAVLGKLGLVAETQDSWVQAFGQSISCDLIDAGQFPTKLRALAPEFVPHTDVLEEAMSTVDKWIESYLRGCAASNDTNGVVRGLTGRIALTKPNIVRETRFGAFADRAVLLLGLSDATTVSQLRSVMFTMGGFDRCSVFREMGVALLVFRSAGLAARVLSEPKERWAGSGFSECRPAPGAEEASKFAENCTQPATSGRRLGILEQALG